MAQAQNITEEDLLISLTFHNFSASLLKEFAQKIVKPYFSGNMTDAVQSLMEKVIHDEKIANRAIEQKKW